MIEKFVVPDFDGTEDSINRIYNLTIDAMCTYEAPAEIISYYVYSRTGALSLNLDSVNQFLVVSKIIEKGINNIIDHINKDAN